MNAIILSLSIVFQYAAAVIAFWHTKKANRHIGWLFLATAILLMAIRRSITFLKAYWVNDFSSVDANTELVALCISILMVIGVYLISSLFDQMRQMQSQLELEKDYALLNAEISEKDKTFFENVIDGLSANIAILDQAGTIVLVNSAWKQFAKENNAGSNQDFIGINYLEICQTASKNECKEALQIIEGIQSVLNGELNKFELIYPCHSPELKRWFECKVTPYAVDSLPYIIISHENITLRIQSDEALNALATTFSARSGQSLFDGVSKYLATELRMDFVIIGELDDQIQQVQIRSAYHKEKPIAAFSYDLENTPCQNVTRKSICVYDSGIQQLFPQDKLLEEMNIDGYVGSLLKSSTGQPLGILAVMNTSPIHNVDSVKALIHIFSERVSSELERMIIEEKLVQSEEQYRAVIENTPDYIAIINCNYIIQYINKVKSGYEIDNVIGSNALEYIEKPYKTDYQNLLNNTIQRKEINNIELCTNRQDFFNCRLVPLTLPSGEDVALVIATEITELKKLNEQLLHSQKMEAIGVLAGGVAHDFNNILFGILGYSELALDQCESNQEEHKYIEQIQYLCKRATMLTRQLLAFSRKQPIQPEIMNLEENIRAIHKTLLPLLGESIEIELNLDSDTGFIEVDPGQMDQILINLAVNARDAMPNGGNLTIQTYHKIVDIAESMRHPGLAPGEYAVLSVSDNGIGMSNETMKRIFEPFFTTKEKSKGTGLGLSTVFGIVQQNNGYIDVQSELNKGTVFNIYTPSIDLISLHETESESLLPESIQATIFVVEDDEAIRNFLKIILENAGYTIHLFDSPVEAELEFLKIGSEINLLITDVVLPKKNGKELAENLCKINSELQVIFMSGYADDVLDANDIMNKDIYFLQKPFSQHDLLNLIHTVLTNHNGNTGN